jgi:hypothetical protein
MLALPTIQNYALPLVLYENEMWSLTLWKKHRPGVFENRVLGSVFEPKREKVTGGWKKFCNEELYNLYCCQILLG